MPFPLSFDVVRLTSVLIGTVHLVQSLLGGGMIASQQYG